MTATPTTAAFYVASPGYLFQTAVSAMQARRWLPASTQVLVFFVSGGTPTADEEFDVFEPVLAAAGVELRPLKPVALRGMAFTYSRFFAESEIDAGVKNLLYLDGDTQVLGSVAPLVDHDPGRDVLAAPDPMAAMRRAGGRLAAKADQFFDASGVSPEHRDSYINAGVLFAARETFVEIGEWSQRTVADAGRDFPFRDQDAVNIGFQSRIRPVSAVWNFPGFMYGTPSWVAAQPRIVHYMANPRPWFGVYRPFGAGPHAPYRGLAETHPELAPYWIRPTGRRLLKSRAVELYKVLLEAPMWRSSAMTAGMAALEARIDEGTGR